ncbi:hypothetical protein N507_2020 [Lacticaseibacillus rhamnosus DSM 14870]|nr:hypothetical protein N507_2020 [Lacticaseibacillus rhamnosus DSM 14870]EKS49045.1 hypothetical protein LRHMDP2_2531 [Lacticaseibacillus rhamnosus LRHMDP2]
MAKARPSRLRPLTLRFLNGLARAHKKGERVDLQPGVQNIHLMMSAVPTKKCD